MTRLLAVGSDPLASREVFALAAAGATNQLSLLSPSPSRLHSQQVADHPIKDSRGSNLCTVGDLQACRTLGDSSAAVGVVDPALAESVLGFTDHGSLV